MLVAVEDDYRRRVARYESPSSAARVAIWAWYLDLAPKGSTERRFAALMLRHARQLEASTRRIAGVEVSPS